MRRELQLRPNVKPNSFVMELIGNKRCMHYDVWLAMDWQWGQRLYIVIQLRSGGRDLVAAYTYAVIDGALQMVVRAPENCEVVTLQDKALWPRYKELNALHWQAIVPLVLGELPEGYTSRSVSLHYIRIPDITPVPDGVVNMHRYGENDITANVLS